MARAWYSLVLMMIWKPDGVWVRLFVRIQSLLGLSCILSLIATGMEWSCGVLVFISHWQILPNELLKNINLIQLRPLY